MTSDGKVVGVKLQKMRLGEPDASGRRSPQPVPGSEYVRECDLVISTIGMSPDAALYATMAGVARSDRIKVDPVTLQSDIPYLFAAGDVTTGATDITTAIGAGRRAAHMLDRWIHDLPLDGFTALDDRLATNDHDTVLARQTAFGHRHPVSGDVSLVPHPADFTEIEAALTEDQARAGAGSCLDCGVCSECQECVKACPADCIDFDLRDTVSEVEVGAVVVSTGHKLFAADLKPEYGFGRFPNVITGMQMDRLLAPTRPFNTILRPSDGKVPDRIAYVSCTGSRDKQGGNEPCSKSCCMYSSHHNHCQLTIYKHVVPDSQVSQRCDLADFV